MAISAIPLFQYTQLMPYSIGEVTSQIGMKGEVATAQGIKGSVSEAQGIKGSVSAVRPFTFTISVEGVFEDG